MDPSETPQATPESPEGPDVAEGESGGLSDSQLVSGAQGASGQLAEEYKPYSQFPWQEIPEESREPFLRSLKKFHGDMTRSSQEAADLRRRVPELQQKAEFLDRLATDPAFAAWYQQRYMGAPAQPAPGKAPEDVLSGSLDKDATSAIRDMIRQELAGAINPVRQELGLVQRMAGTEKTERELNDLRSKIRSKGWPDVDNYVTGMTHLVTQGRARTVEDAYLIAAHEDLLRAEVESAVNRQRERLEGKASVTFAPGGGPSGTPIEGEFSGPDATLRALQAAKKEMARSLRS